MRNDLSWMARAAGLCCVLVGCSVKVDQGASGLGGLGSADAGPSGGGGQGGSVGGNGGTGGSGAAGVMAGGGASGTAGAMPSGGSGGTDGGGDEPCDGADLQTDAENCGACEHNCQGAVCVAGLCTPTQLGTDSFDLYAIAVDDENIYYQAYAAILSLPLTGGESTILVEADADHHIYDMRLRNGTLYYLSQGRIADDDVLSLYALPTAGGDPVPVFMDSLRTGSHLEVTETHAYYTSWCSTIWAAPLSGGEPIVTLDWSCNSFGDRKFDVDPAGEYAYIVTADRHDVIRQKLDDNTIEMVIPQRSVDFVASNERLYWPTATCTFEDQLHPMCEGAAIRAIDVTGENEEQLVDLGSVTPADGIEEIGRMVLDDTAMYFIISDVGGFALSIYRAPLEGGEPLLLARTEDANESELAVDDTFLYFGCDKGVFRVAK